MWYNRRQCLFKFGYMLEYLLEFYKVNLKKSVNQQESYQSLNSSTITRQISLKIITLIVNDLVFSIRIMIWSICFMQLISNDSLSRLGSSKSFLPSAYSLSHKIKKLGSFSRPYSTYSVKSYNINEIDNNKSIKFDSLELKSINLIFIEWFRGFTDAEWSFSIKRDHNSFTFIFRIKLHIDDINVLLFIKKP
uniref:Homing endonuclease LAGLIDADG domain-containing protein n=1 Tax=Orbilia brochopaga TaxID=3140254 RepID=A0A481ZN83_9PEZI|nr:hypothetical protein [Drechslerella brochopaga]QBL02566.1 hypothetical protein [Drechslerella brochopaga]